MTLPYFQSTLPELSRLQTTWATQINPVLNNVLLNGLALNAVVLIVGVNTINHRLSRQQQGWFITDRNAGGEIFRSAPFNGQTLQLTSNAAVTVNLWVY